ncbi:MAG: biopolymer transporter ExbD [Treponema sp.]|jgi:biopolymer transport protein ExbD|nr:biopolymer transporter ExbD [Treponema sp.]MBQ1644611.1 biopolymer transporter ExbD [Treponema sp.]MBQ1671565.1 biopolymer transporter ExbD [Treponema sp.]MBQ1713260.1 biopolymer transporter ExbD [Treponema sp.]MBQ1728707.1 biopolymer transporter ExbD [Treponema sp.]
MVNIKKKRRNPSITTSSMSDIGFLLLIFIMLISLMNQRYEEKINYSESTALERTQADSNFEIWIQKNGVISAEGKDLDSVGLERAVVSAIAANPNVRIHVIADRDTPYKYVNSVVGVLQSLQHRVVSFVVKEG